MIKSKSITESLDFPEADGAAGLAAGLAGDCTVALGAEVCAIGFGEAAGFAEAVEDTGETDFAA